jgi:hypothetical protein
MTGAGSGRYGGVSRTSALALRPRPGDRGPGRHDRGQDGAAGVILAGMGQYLSRAGRDRGTGPELAVGGGPGRGTMTAARTGQGPPACISHPARATRRELTLFWNAYHTTAASPHYARSGTRG